MQQGNKRATKKEKEEAINLYEQGMTLVEVGVILGRHHTTILKWLKGKIRTQRLEVDTIQKIAYYYDKGWSYNKIAYEVGCHASSVGIYVRKLGIYDPKRAITVTIPERFLKKPIPKYTKPKSYQDYLQEDEERRRRDRIRRRRTRLA